MTAPKFPLCAIIKTQDGVTVVCDVLAYPVIDFGGYFPLVHVRARRGRPFNNLREILISVSKVTFASMRTQEAN